MKPISLTKIAYDNILCILLDYFNFDDIEKLKMLNKEHRRYMKIPISRYIKEVHLKHHLHSFQNSLHGCSKCTPEKISILKIFLSPQLQHTYYNKFHELTSVEINVERGCNINILPKTLTKIKINFYVLQNISIDFNSFPNLSVLDVDVNMWPDTVSIKIHLPSWLNTLILRGDECTKFYGNPNLVYFCQFSNWKSKNEYPFRSRYYTLYEGEQRSFSERNEIEKLVRGLND